MSTTKTLKKGINLSDIKVGDVFYEESHYIYEGRTGNVNQLKHLSSGQSVNLTDKYISELLISADQYDVEVKVGKEDKFWTAKQLADEKNTTNREGDLKQKGIRSIWGDITTGAVFMVCYNKQPKEMSKKALDEARNKQLVEAISRITNAQKNKKGVAAEATEVIKEIQNNPILPIEKGEERILRGYKTQFHSINGQYDVIDMDVQTGSQKRVVTVNNILWLIYKNVRYVVE